jgi:hypothetical protein
VTDRPAPDRTPGGKDGATPAPEVLFGLGAPLRRSVPPRGGRDRIDTPPAHPTGDGPEERRPAVSVMPQVRLTIDLLSRTGTSAVPGVGRPDPTVRVGPRQNGIIRHPRAVTRVPSGTAVTGRCVLGQRSWRVPHTPSVPPHGRWPRRASARRSAGPAHRHEGDPSTANHPSRQGSHRDEESRRDPKAIYTESSRRNPAIASVSLRRLCTRCWSDCPPVIAKHPGTWTPKILERVWRNGAPVMFGSRG